MTHESATDWVLRAGPIARRLNEESKLDTKEGRVLPNKRAADIK